MNFKKNEKKKNLQIAFWSIVPIKYRISSLPYFGDGKNNVKKACYLKINNSYIFNEKEMWMSKPIL